MSDFISSLREAISHVRASDSPVRASCFLGMKLSWICLKFIVCFLVSLSWGITVGLVEGLIFALAGFTKTGRRITRNTMTGRGAVRMFRRKL